MKKLVIILFVAALFAGCEEKEKPIPDYNIQGKWQVICVDCIHYDKSYILKLDDNSFQINLDVNTYTGEFFSYKTHISFDSFVHTKLCCDSDKALKIIKNLKSANRFIVDKNTLIIKSNKIAKYKRIK